MLLLVISAVLSYLIGAISFAKLTANIKHVDLFKTGSGNLGATNVYRVLGFWYALLVFVLDVLKGFIVVCVAQMLWPHNYYWHLVCGLLAVIGHTYSPYVKFKGGKGAATGMGLLMAIDPVVFVIAMSLAIVMIKTWRLVSLATLTVALIVPLILYARYAPSAYLWFAVIVSGYIYHKHLPNIQRLLQGKENRI